MYEDFDPTELHGDDKPVKKIVVDEKTLPIPAGKVITLDYLYSREWSLSRVDATVRSKGITYLPGRNAYITNREIY
jgi:hypothetical protein